MKLIAEPKGYSIYLSQFYLIYVLITYSSIIVVGCLFDCPLLLPVTKVHCYEEEVEAED